MLTRADRTKHFQELQGLMSEVTTHYQNLGKEFPADSSEHHIVTKLVETHEAQQKASLQSPPADDKGMEEVATDMRSYVKVTDVYIADLRSASNPGKVYTELVKAHRKVKDWYENVLQLLKPPAPSSAPSAAVPPGAPPPSGTPSTPGTPQPGKAPTQPLIISLLKAGHADQEYIKLTTTLLAGHTPDPPLQDKQVEALVQLWRTAIDSFMDPMKRPGVASPPDLATIIGLIKLQSELDTLYEQLIAIEESKRVSVPSLLSIR